jgi:hypothetical protein
MVRYGGRMPRRRRGRDVEPAGDGAKAREEGRYLSAWGLQPAQWRPVGSMALVRTRAILLWRPVDDDAVASDIALRARRAYDRLGELGVTVAADSTREGIEVTVPLSRTALALRILADRSILPDAVLVADAPADQLRVLRRDVGAYRGRVELVIGHESAPDAIAELRSRVRAG